MIMLTEPKFTCGALLATPGASEAFCRNNQTPFEFLSKHLNGDWGEMCPEDKLLNDEAMTDGSRLMSAYRLRDGTKIWCITEAKGENGRREATTFLLPDEY